MVVEETGKEEAVAKIHFQINFLDNSKEGEDVTPSLLLSSLPSPIP